MQKLSNTKILKKIDFSKNTKNVTCNYLYFFAYQMWRVTIYILCCPNFFLEIWKNMFLPKLFFRVLFGMNFDSQLEILNAGAAIQPKSGSHERCLQLDPIFRLKIRYIWKYQPFVAEIAMPNQNFDTTLRNFKKYAFAETFF